MPRKRAPEIAISVKVSKDSAEGWKGFCDKNGVTLSAFIEVAGLMLVDETVPPTVKERARMVEKAREVDRTRRVRKRRKS